MRIRSIKPEFWRSQDITDLDWETRLLFIGLWSYVDDNGVGKDHEPSIIGDLFAADMFSDPRETVARVSRGLQKLSEAGRIARYDTEKGPCLYIVNWSKHQRIDKPNRARLDPPPPELQASGGDSRGSRESVAKSQRIPAPGTEEQGNRGTGEQSSSSDVASDDHDAGETFEPHVYELCDHLAEHIRRNGNKVSTVGKRWHQAMDRLNRIDGYTPEQIRQVIDWSQQDEFWQGNILSAPKLREKFDQLKTRMLNERNKPATGQPYLSASERRYTQGANLVADELAEFQANFGELTQ